MGDLKEQVLILSSPREKERLETFLTQQNLALEQNIDYAMVLVDDGQIVAAGAFAGNILKGIAVAEKYKGYDLAAKVITHLINELYKRGITHHFVFTKPANKAIFSELGFFSIVESEKVILLENKKDGVKQFITEIIAESGPIVPASAIVVNCNPFTLGHQYLIEYAARQCDKLHIFVVWEDKSSFPAEIRYDLVKKGVDHLTNVCVHKGKDYIISGATFPSYFLKKFDDVVTIQARLDLKLFAEQIAQPLKINKRFVGDEPYCLVTSEYNRTMKKLLPSYGISIEVIPRLKHGNQAISASRVRELIRANDIEGTKTLVPKTTYDFLTSNVAKNIINKIQSSTLRH